MQGGVLKTYLKHNFLSFLFNRTSFLQASFSFAWMNSTCLIAQVGWEVVPELLKNYASNYFEQLRWESLKKRRTDNRLILLYKGLKGKARIPTDDLIPKTRRCRNSHSKAFQLPSASIEAYKCSFFPQTIRDWNDLPDSLFSTAEMSDDCVSKFASLVRSRD